MAKKEKLKEMPDQPKEFSPFDWIEAITVQKSDPFEEHGPKAYAKCAFMINRGLSYYPDTCLYASELNLYQDVPPHQAYGYYRASIRPMRRRSGKWGKRGSSKDVEFLMERLNYSRKKAQESLAVMSPELLEKVKEEWSRGREDD